MSLSGGNNIHSWESPWNAPEKFGCRAVAELDTGGSYEFDMVCVVQVIETGDVYAAQDSGCSCPTPFEDHTWPTDWTLIRKADDLDPLIALVYKPDYSEVLTFKREVQEALNVGRGRSDSLVIRPSRELGTVYSNYDHELDGEIASVLERDGELYGQHAAWDFCGWVWRLPDGRWVDQVWRYGAPVEDVIGETLQEVIDEANDRWGHQ